VAVQRGTEVPFLDHWPNNERRLVTFHRVCLKGDASKLPNTFNGTLTHHCGRLHVAEYRAILALRELKIATNAGVAT
jgi:hypothetical protein